MRVWQQQLQVACYQGGGTWESFGVGHCVYN